MNPTKPFFQARKGARRTGQAVLLSALLCLAGCKTDLYVKLSEGEANEMLAALMLAGVDAEKSTQDEKVWAVQVERNALPAALNILKGQGLPKERFASVGEIFKKEGIVSTPSEERIRYIYAVSQELSSTLSKIDGVLIARVHVVIPAADPLSDAVKPSSAAVFIKHRADANVQALAPTVKNLVMRGIEGLVYDNIALSFFPAEEKAPQVVRAGAATNIYAWSGALAALLLLIMFKLVVRYARRGPAQLAGQVKAPADGMAGVLQKIFRRPVSQEI